MKAVLKGKDSKLSEKIGQLRVLTDGDKKYLTDVADTKIFLSQNLRKY